MARKFVYDRGGDDEGEAEETPVEDRPQLRLTTGGDIKEIVTLMQQLERVLDYNELCKIHIFSDFHIILEVGREVHQDPQFNTTPDWIIQKLKQLLSLEGVEYDKENTTTTAQ